jgi:mRNA interferase HigB
MRVISNSRLKQFWTKYPNSETSLRKWYKIANKAQWKNPADVRATFNSADFVKDFVVFNIGGNNYRLIAKIDYQRSKVYIRHVLTHTEYDKDEWKADE